MEITLSSKGDYAVRAVLDLAMHYGRGLRKSREIAEAMRIPPNFLPIILADLVHAGVLNALAGRAGGYELARPPGTITLLEVVEIAEGPITVKRCPLRGIPCGAGGYCAAHESWASAEQALARRLGATSFATLAATNRRLLGTDAGVGQSRAGRTR